MIDRIDSIEKADFLCRACQPKSTPQSLLRLDQFLMGHKLKDFAEIVLAGTDIFGDFTCPDISTFRLVGKVHQCLHNTQCCF